MERYRDSGNYFEEFANGLRHHQKKILKTQSPLRSPTRNDPKKNFEMTINENGSNPWMIEKDRIRQSYQSQQQKNISSRLAMPKG